MYTTLEIYNKRIGTKLLRLKNRLFRFTLHSSRKVARRQKGFEFGRVYRQLIWSTFVNVSGEKVGTTSTEAELYRKGKAITLQAWTGPEGSSRLRLSDFKTIGT